MDYLLKRIDCKTGPGGTIRTSGRAIIGRVLHHLSYAWKRTVESARGLLASLRRVSGRSRSPCIRSGPDALSSLVRDRGFEPQSDVSRLLYRTELIPPIKMAPGAGVEPARLLVNSQMPFQLGYPGMKLVAER